MQQIYGIIIFLTGCCSLIYQVIWQKYLHLFVGSEMRSTTMIVAIFLAGLSIGYILFGRLSTRFAERRAFLKCYGYVEIATGAYAIFFPQLFAWLDASPLAHQASLMSEFLIASLLLLPPTILMGATIPVMTTVMPDQNAGVNRGHALIYGLNTLGAFVGVLLASFVLIAHFGLLMSLMITGIVNVLCGVVYVGNRLQGTIRKADAMPLIASNYTTNDVYLLAFVSGLVSISLEIIWIRLLALTIGSSFIVFPIILSLFVLGLGIGSLTVKTVTPTRLRRQFYVMLSCLVLSFLVVPYLPLWFSNLRVSFDSQPINYYLFHTAVYLGIGAVILSFLIPMGRLLPMSYAFLEKDAEQYGFKCGFLYFINTSGTILGTVFLSYLSLYIFSIETIYKINIAIITTTFIWVLLKDQRFLTMATVGILFAAMAFGAIWDRRFHVFGLYISREPSVYNVRGAFNLSPAADHANIDVTYFKDGPDSTVSVMHGRRQYPDGETADFKSIVINGKSDSSTLEDYTTLSLAAFLPYVYTAKANDLNTALVGQGTGVTAGILSQFQDVAQVDLIEISPAVIGSLPQFSEYTYNVQQDAKVTIHQLDAFKHFRRRSKSYDIIVSEPTNLWIVGVENLYTPYFYNLAKSSMHRGGVLAQWMHTSQSNHVILNTIFNNLLQVFPYAEVYEVRQDNIIILASDQPLKPNQQTKRVQEPVTQEIFRKLNFKQNETYRLLRKFDTAQLKYIAAARDKLHHSIQHPTLSMQSYKAFFLGESANIHQLIEPYIARVLHPYSESDLIRVLESHVRYNDDLQSCSVLKKGIETDLLCKRIIRHMESYRIYKSNSDILTRLNAYAALRQNGFLGVDEPFLEQIYAEVMTQEALRTPQNYVGLIREYLREGMILKAIELVRTGTEMALISQAASQQTLRDIEAIGQQQLNARQALEQLTVQH